MHARIDEGCIEVSECIEKGIYFALIIKIVCINKCYIFVLFFYFNILKLVLKLQNLKSFQVISQFMLRNT